MTPAQKAQQTAYNEFIADYVERHGECKATRDEAHEVADWIVAVSRGAANLIDAHSVNDVLEDDIASDFVGQLIDAHDDIDVSGRGAAKYLASCAIAAALEVAP